MDMLIAKKVARSPSTVRLSSRTTTKSSSMKLIECDEDEMVIKSENAD